MYTFEYIDTQQIDEENKFVTVKTENFFYYIRCFQNIIQYIHGEFPESYNNWENPPTEQQILEHDLREEEFNRDHTILQGYIDSL